MVTESKAKIAIISQQLNSFSQRPIPVKLFRRWMQNYATVCDKIIQHYATLNNPRPYIAAYSQHYRRKRLFLRR